MTDLVALRAANEKRWQAAKLNRNFSSVARALVEPKAKARYQAVSARTGVPWFIIAVIHERESSQNWNTQLAQGDPLSRKSIHVPAGEGPYATWEEGAVYALTHHYPWGVRPTDWSAGGSLTYLEGFNGPGYANRNLPSPYIWSGTDQYKAGKYIRDGVFDPNVIDVQLGCAGLLKAMMALDPTITFTGLKVVQPEPAPQPKATTTTKKASVAVVAGGAAAGVAHQSGLGIGWIIGIGLVVAVDAFLIWKMKGK